MAVSRLYICLYRPNGLGNIPFLLMQTLPEISIAFNEFLRILFETGIAGFVLFVLLIFTGCRHSFRGNQKSRDAGSVFLAILSFGFFSYPFSIGLIITIAVAALAVIAGNVSSPVLVKKGRWKTGYRFVAGLSFFPYRSLLF